MSQIVASTYELIEKIGAGGGGVVYMGRHLRLDKLVVLKADKRTLTAKPEALRREVDALKNLSHTYIPQVYDFIVEDGMVYTVMDYIEGESLDKPLQRRERFSQPQIIEWACELLEALCYLHGRPPHGILHSDIKPANIMRTPQNDIRLIDFNIALALGEDGAVQVGYSLGYASPEHYGTGTTDTWRTNEPSRAADQPLNAATVPLPQVTQPLVPSTEKLGQYTTPLEQKGSLPGDMAGEAPGHNRGGRHRPVLLDVRSDIYSLGATLYHLLTGIKPARDAWQVVPIEPAMGVSQAVADIIRKAMMPDPKDRFQTAEEMLYAFEHLHETDYRTNRYRRGRNIAAAVLAAAFLVSGSMAFAGLRQMEQTQAEAAQAAQEAEEAERLAKQALADVRSAEGAYGQGNLPDAARLAVRALTVDSPYSAQAQKALTDALGVYDLSDGLKAHRTAEMPSEVLKLEISPAGTRTAMFYAYEIMVMDTETGEQLTVLPAYATATSDLCFLGESTLVYAGENGVQACDVETGTVLWQGQPATHLALSGDGSRVAGIFGAQPQAIVYDTGTGTAVKMVCFDGRGQSLPAGDGILADPGDSLLAMNEDGTILAVSLEGGGLYLYDLAADDSVEVFGTSEYTHFEGNFYDRYFAFSAWNAEECVFQVIDLEAMAQTGGFTGQAPFYTASDQRGVCVASGGVLVQLHPVTGEQTELAYVNYDIAAFTWGKNGHVLVSGKDGYYALFDGYAQQIAAGRRESGCELLATAGPYAVLASRETPVVQVLKLTEHPDAQLCGYDPAYVHDEARLSADGTTVMLFRYDRFYLLDAETGSLRIQVELPDAMEVYDQQYRREGGQSALEVTWRDGTIRAYSAVDGSMLWERKGAAPDQSLAETFETTRWVISAPLHGTPTVYDRGSGELYTELEQDSYLTYVTEVGEYIVTQYLSGQGESYGLLLNQDCETLAYLPDLCDVIGETLVFDDGMGNLRQSRIYSREELIVIAGAHLK